MKRSGRIGFLGGILVLLALLIYLWGTPIPPVGDDSMASPVEFPQGAGSVLARIVPEAVLPTVDGAVWEENPCLVVAGRVEEDLHGTLPADQTVWVVLAAEDDALLPSLQACLEQCSAFYAYDPQPLDEVLTAGGQEVFLLEDALALRVYEEAWLPLTAEGQLDLAGLQSCLREGDAPFPEPKFGEDLADGEALRQLLLERSDPDYVSDLMADHAARQAAEWDAYEAALARRQTGTILCCAGIALLLAAWLFLERRKKT